MSAEGAAWVVRHAQTGWALSGRHTGRTDIPLTACGEREARDLGRLLGTVRFSHVLSSPRQRAVRTCALALPGQASEIEADLEEWDYGDYEGRRSTEIRKERADWELFRDGCPGGESPAQVSRRADRLISRLRGLDGNIALLTHGQFSCVLAARWIGLPLADARHFTIGTASFGVLASDPHHPSVPVIRAWNVSSGALFPGSPGLSSRERRVTGPGAIERWENEGGEVWPGANP